VCARARLCACEGSKSAHELARVCVQGGQPQDGALPSAATCSFEMHIPVYSSQAVMLRQLLTAIETEDFGTR
jgi:hypothetical protein